MLFYKNFDLIGEMSHYFEQQFLIIIKSKFILLCKCIIVFSLMFPSLLIFVSNFVENIQNGQFCNILGIILQHFRNLLLFL